MNSTEAPRGTGNVRAGESCASYASAQAVGPGAGPASRLEGLAIVLGDALQTWDAWDGSAPEAETLDAVNTAVDTIDAMLRELYALRGRLVAGARVAGDASAAAADALLAQHRDGDR